jgi:hypothetical protein
MDEPLFLATCDTSRRSSQMIALTRDRIAASREAIARTWDLLQSLKVYPYDKVFSNSPWDTLSIRVSLDARQLRATDFIRTDRSRVNIPDWEKLKHVGDFDPLYLHLKIDVDL